MDAGLETAATVTRTNLPHQAVFDAAQAKTALTREKKYICGGNFFWHSLLESPTPGVPLRLERVMELGKHMYGQDMPSHMPTMIHIMLDNSEYPILNHKGALLRVSPEEHCHAAIFMCAKAIADKLTTNQKLERWKQIFLSCCFCFEVADGQDAAYWRAYNLRQQTVAEYGAVRRTAWQMAHEIAGFKRMREQDAGNQLTKKQVTELYQKRGKTAKESETVTENYIATALNVYDKICSVPRLSACIEDMEAMYGLQSCFGNMSNLNTIIQKTDDLSMRTWVMEAIVEGCKAGTLTNDDITKSTLAGTHTTVSLCTLLQFKRQVMTRYLSQDLPQLCVDHGDLQMFRDVLCDHGSYRDGVKGHDGHEADTTWLGRCKPSSIQALRLLEDHVLKLRLGGTSHLVRNLLLVKSTILVTSCTPTCEYTRTHARSTPCLAMHIRINNVKTPHVCEEPCTCKEPYTCVDHECQMFWALSGFKACASDAHHITNAPCCARP